MESLKMRKQAAPRRPFAGRRAVRQLRCLLVSFSIIVEHAPYSRLPAHSLSNLTSSQTYTAP